MALTLIFSFSMKLFFDVLKLVRFLLLNIKHLLFDIKLKKFLIKTCVVR